MSKTDALEQLVGRGLDSDLAQRVLEAGYTLTKLASVTKKELRKHLANETEVDEVYRAGRREPIPSDVVERLVRECDWKCCICSDMRLQPVIIHHIEEYAKTQNNDYDNLVVLCVRHHVLAHTTCSIARQPLPPSLIRERKRAWVEAVQQFKAGLRKPPADNDELWNAFLKPDIEALREYRAFFDRRAFHVPFKKEDMSDFPAALEHLSLIMKTGLRQTRHGQMLPTKAQHAFNNRNWADAIETIGHRIEDLQERFAAALRDGELEPDTFFHNEELAVEIDNMRDAIIGLFNKVFMQAGLKPLRGVDRSSLGSQRAPGGLPGPER